MEDNNTNTANTNPTTNTPSPGTTPSSLSNHSVKVSIAEGAFAGTTGFASGPAVLSWGPDKNTPILLKKESGETVFSAEPRRIEKFYVNFNIIDMIVDGEKYRLFSRGAGDDVAYTAGMLTGSGAGLSVAEGTAEFSLQGIEDLKKLLADAGAKTNRNPIDFAMKFILAVVLFVIISITLLILWIMTFYTPQS